MPYADPEKRKACCAAYRAAHPEKDWTYRIKMFFGLTVQAYDAMLLAQGRRCAICRCPEPGGRGRWHVDHDHACCSGKRTCGRCVRGLLCYKCNAAIGYLHDDPTLLRAALTYLEHSRPHSERNPLAFGPS